MSTLQVANIVGQPTSNLGTTSVQSVAVSGTLTQNGAATFSNTVNITGATTFSNTTTHTGAATFSNTIAVTGNAVFSNLVTVAASGIKFPDGSTQTTAYNNSTFSGNLSGSRTFGTIYQNTSGKVLVVIPSVSKSTTGYSLYMNIAAASSSLNSGASSGGTTYIEEAATYYLANGVEAFYGFVPPGWYYNLTNDGDSWSIRYWYEISL